MLATRELEPVSSTPSRATTAAPAAEPHPPIVEPSILAPEALRRSLWRDLHDLYAFYLDDDHRRRLRSMGRLRRWATLTTWLIQSLLTKLSPLRRILTGASLALFVAGWSGLRLDFGVVLDPTTQGFTLLLFVLMAELRDKLLARDELEVGRQVQQALLPRRHPELAGWTLWSHSSPAREVGGDLVDYVPARRGRLGAVVGDVSGKGLGAALLMTRLQSTLRALAPSTPSLSELAGRMNEVFDQDGLENRFATLLYVEIEPDGGRLRYLNAGHNPALLVRHADPTTPETLAATGMPLGIDADVTFVEGVVEMHPGDLLVVYSDGLTEACDAHGEEFGVERLRRRLDTLRVDDAEGVGRALLRDWAAFTDDQPRHDDVSLLVLHRDR